MSAPALTSDQNILPVQAYFNLDGSFNTFIGQGQPFYATLNPIQSGLTITNSTINSTSIGLITPSSGVFTNISTTTGSISTTPVNPTNIVNKSYVDAYLQGLSFKAPAQVATTANITLFGLQTIDGYTTLVGDRVLVKNQTTQQDNGIYLTSASAWTRSSDAATYAELVAAFLFIENGTSQTGSAWVSTIPQNGTFGVTPITFTQFSNTATYTAGTGLTLSNYQFSITPVGTSGTYGSASSVPVFVTNASGQVSSVTNTTISIAPSQINATIPNSGLTNSTISGVALGSNLANLTAGTNITFSSGTTYNGSSAITINASSTMVYPGAGIPNSTGSAWGTSYSTTGSGTVVALATSPTFVTPILGTPQSGNFSTGTFTWPTFNQNTTGNASTATTANNLSGTTQYSLPYQSASATTGYLSPGTANSVLITNGVGSAPSWATQASLSVGSATNIAGGTAGAIAYNSAANTTTFLTLGTSGYVLTAGANAPQYTAQSSLAVGTATNIAGGAASQIPYQTGSGATTFLANGTIGQVLTSNGASAPSWTTPTAYATVTDDTTTNATRYPLFANQTSGNITTEYTSSTKYQFNPSTGVLTATQFTGSGAGLTSIPNSALTNSSITVGSTAISLGSSATTIAGLTSVTSTTFVGALTGNASTATSATTATNATNTAITDDTTTATTVYPTWVTTTTGNLPQKTASTKLSFVPSTGVLSATSFTGAGTGLTGTASSLSIGGNAANVTGTVAIANGGSGQTTAQLAINAFAGAVTSGSYLRGNGTNVVMSTIQAADVPTLNQNTTGTASNVTGTVVVANGGTGVTTLTGVAYGNGTSAFTAATGSQIATAIGSTAVTNATNATNIVGGTAGAIAYQTGSGVTSFLSLGTSGYVLTSGASAPSYTAQSSLAVGTATNLAGGVASNIPYQSGAGATAFLANGTTGQVLTSNGASAPSWTTPTAYATVTDDTTTAGSRYLLFANQTSGNLTTEYTSSTKLTYYPNTGCITNGLNGGTF